MSDDRRDAIGDAITRAAPELFAQKAHASFGVMATLAILAGIFIAFGSVAFLVAQAVPGAPTGAVQLVSGLAFSVGLILTMITGAELFTGNTMFVLAVRRGRLSVGRMAAAWILVWFGNLVGSLLVAWLFVQAGGGDALDGMVGAAATEVAVAKVDKTIVNLIASGILANMLVCLAVWMAMAAQSVPSKILAIIGPVTVFVAAGFEHSIANQSLLPIGWLLQTDDSILLVDIARNLGLSTIGNVIGGASIALAFERAHRDA